MNFYAVHKGNTTGIFNNWEDCKKSVSGYKNARFKKFDNEEDAKFFVENGHIKLYDNDKNIHIQNGCINVYTDGSLFKTNDVICCGYGIYIPCKNIKIHKPLISENITNNRAELMAIIESLEILKNEDNIMIHTDSQYCIYIFTGTGIRYKQTNYVNKSGNLYPNHDLIEIGLKLIENKNVIFNKIESHTDKKDENSLNNDIADELAILGAIEMFERSQSIENYKFCCCRYTMNPTEIKKIHKNYIEWFLNNQSIIENLRLKEKLKINYLFCKKYIENIK